jgi:hypothetical protein
MKKKIEVRNWLFPFAIAFCRKIPKSIFQEESDALPHGKNIAFLDRGR